MRTLLIALLTGLIASTAYAQVIKTLPIQGQLFQRDGTPLPDGEYEMNVSLYEVATGGTGVAICNPCTINMETGVFQLVLGDEGQEPLPAMDRTWYVSITVNGEELQPRIRLHPVAYAHEALNHPQQPSGVPVGTVIAFAGPPPNNPSDYMVADGRAVSSTEYPELFRAIGRTWGSGGDDGTDETDFNLPDLRGIFLRGDDMGSGRDNMLISRTYKSTKVSDTSTVGSYYGADGMKFTAEMGQIHATRSDAFSNDGGGGPSSTGWGNVALYTPNAAVVYMIKVK